MSEPTKKRPAVPLRLDQMNKPMRSFMVSLRISAHIDPSALRTWMAEKRHELALGYLKALERGESENSVEDFVAYARRQYQRARERAV